MSTDSLHITRRVTPGTPESVQHARMLQKRAPHVKSTCSSYKPHRRMLQMLSDRFTSITCPPDITCRSKIEDLCASSSASILLGQSSNNILEEHSPTPLMKMEYGCDLPIDLIITKTPSPLDHDSVAPSSLEENSLTSVNEKHSLKVKLEPAHIDLLHAVEAQATLSNNDAAVVVASPCKNGRISIRPCHVMLTKLDEDYISSLSGECRTASVGEETESERLTVHESDDDGLPDIVYTPAKRHYSKCSSDTVTKNLSNMHHQILKKWRALLPERKEGFTTCEDWVQSFKSTRDKVAVGEINDIDNNLQDTESCTDEQCDTYNAVLSEQNEEHASGQLSDLKIDFKLLDEVVDELTHTESMNLHAVVAASDVSPKRDNKTVKQEKVSDSPLKTDTHKNCNDGDQKSLVEMKVAATASMFSDLGSQVCQLSPVPVCSSVSVPSKSRLSPSLQCQIPVSTTSPENSLCPPESFHIRAPPGWRIPKLTKPRECPTSTVQAKFCSTKHTNCRSIKELPISSVLSTKNMKSLPKRSKQQTTTKRHFLDVSSPRPLSGKKCWIPRWRSHETTSALPNRMPSPTKLFTSPREFPSLRQPIAHPDDCEVQNVSMQGLTMHKLPLSAPALVDVMLPEHLSLQASSQPTAVTVAQSVTLTSHLDDQSICQTNQLSSASSGYCLMTPQYQNTIPKTHLSRSYGEISTLKPIDNSVFEPAMGLEGQPQTPINLQQTSTPQPQPQPVLGEFHFKSTSLPTQSVTTRLTQSTRVPAHPLSTITQERMTTELEPLPVNERSPAGLVKSSQLLQTPPKTVYTYMQTHDDLQKYKSEATVGICSSLAPQAFHRDKLQPPVPSLPVQSSTFIEESSYKKLIHSPVCPMMQRSTLARQEILTNSFVEELVDVSKGKIPTRVQDRKWSHSSRESGPSSVLRAEVLHTDLHRSPQSTTGPDTRTVSKSSIIISHTQYNAKEKIAQTKLVNSHSQMRMSADSVGNKSNVSGHSVPTRPHSAAEQSKLCPKSKDNTSTQRKNSGVGKFHGRTLLSGEGVPTRIIPVQPLYLLHPIRQSGRPEVIPIDPRPAHYCRKRKMIEAELFRRRLEIMQGLPDDTAQVVEQMPQPAIRLRTLRYADDFVDHERIMSRGGGDKGNVDRICNDDMELDSD